MIKYKQKMKSKKMLTIGEASKYLGISRDTLRRWEKKNRIKPLRSPTNRRYYTQDQLDQLMGSPQIVVKRNPKKTGGTKFFKVFLFAVLGFLLASLIVSVLQMFIL
jgi:excisionase family DNA binding protein